MTTLEDEFSDAIDQAKALEQRLRRLPRGANGAYDEVLDALKALKTGRNKARAWDGREHPLPAEAV